MISIYSEISPLNKVFLHSPGDEHLYVTPENLNEWDIYNNKLIHNSKYLLFDDLIHLDRAKQEHKLISEVIKYFIGNENCLEFNTLLLDVVSDIQVKKMLIKECLDTETLLFGKKYKTNIYKKLEAEDDKNLLKILLSGYSVQGQCYFTHPLPNLIFTRDIAAVVGNLLFLTWASKAVRNRENILTKYIFKYHKMFKNIKIYDFHKNHPDLYLEGGDIVVFGEKKVCIGISERTSIESIRVISQLIMDEGFDCIYAVELPKKRAMMHLDTIFNRINNNEIVIYTPIIDNTDKQSKVYCIKKEKSINTFGIRHESLLSILKTDNYNLRTIKCGGDKRINQDREQWMDGANFFAISPGVIMGYDCNYYTIKELCKFGYYYVKASDFLNDPSSYKNKSKLIITIPSTELSRGRGGLRCLTLPIYRG